MKSIWYESVEIPKRDPLKGDCKVDAAVIGGGLSGILTAWFLKQAGLKVLVLEGGRIGSGQTGKTTAKITVSHNLIYDSLICGLGVERAQQYADANMAALEMYKKLIQEKQISCDFRICPSYLYSVLGTEKLEKELNAAKQLGIPVVYTQQTELPFSVRSALRYENQACFHPLKFLKHLASELEIVENTRVEYVKEHQVITSCGVVEAEHIVFASHYPFINIPGFYFLRMHQERSYVTAFTGCGHMDGMYLGIDPTLSIQEENHQGQNLSFRSYGDYLLLGGYGHRTGKNTTGGQYEKLRELAEYYWPGCEQKYFWSAQDGMTASKIPYIGKYSSRRSNWYVAAGFQKWGMTSSMVSAMILHDMIVRPGKHTAFENANISEGQVFSPRNLYLIKSMPGFVQEGISAAKNLLKQKLVIPGKYLSEIPAGHGGTIHYRGKKLGVYKDMEGNPYFVTTKCPHLGCELTWNPEEKSWDCPCHGSRFDYRGNLLDNPAQEGISWSPSENTSENKRKGKK